MVAMVAYAENPRYWLDPSTQQRRDVMVSTRIDESRRRSQTWHAWERESERARRGEAEGDFSRRKAGNALISVMKRVRHAARCNTYIVYVSVHALSAVW